MSAVQLYVIECIQPEIPEDAHMKTQKGLRGARFGLSSVAAAAADKATPTQFLAHA